MSVQSGLVIAEVDETFMNEEIRPALVAGTAGTVIITVHYDPPGFSFTYGGTAATADGTIVIKKMGALLITLVPDQKSGVEGVWFENETKRPMVIGQTAPTPPDCLPDSAHDSRYHMQLRSSSELYVVSKNPDLQLLFYSINMNIKLGGNGAPIPYSLDPRIINV